MLSVTDTYKRFLIMLTLGIGSTSVEAQVMESWNLHIKDSLKAEILLVEGDISREAELSIELSKILKMNGEYFEANKVSRFILNLTEHLQIPRIQSKAYANLAEGYRRIGLLDSSFYYADKYVQFITSKNEDLNVLSEFELIHYKLEAHALLAKYYYDNRDPNNSGEVIGVAKRLIESIDINKAREDYPDFRYGLVYDVLGHLHFRYYEMVDAFFYFNKIIEEAENSGDPTLINNVKHWRATLMYETKSYDRPFPKGESALEIILELDVNDLDPMSEVRPWHVYWLTGKLYQKRGDNARFEEYARKSLISVLKTDGYSDIIGVLEATAKSAELLRNYTWKLNNKELMAYYKDYLINANNQIKLLQMEAQLKTAQELSELNGELADQRYRSRLIFAGGLLILIVNILIFRNLRLLKRAKRYQSAANEKLQYEKEVELLKKEKLANLLEYKQRQLTTSTLSAERLNSQMNRMIETLEGVKKSLKDHSSIKSIDRLIRELKSADSDQDNWTQFYKHFESVHPNFFNRLLEINDGLTQNDLRHCAYVQMSLSNKEVAQMYNVDPNSVKMARYRLKKKLHLDQEASLQDFIFQLTNNSSPQYLRGA